MATANGHGHTHGGGHAHSHAHSARADGSRRRLFFVLVLTALYMVAEAVGGWYTGSLALLADAGHMLTDVAALALALTAAWFGSRPATPSKTFGYYRLEILAAFTNGVVLAGLSLYIFYEAYERWSAPPTPSSRTDTLRFPSSSSSVTPTSRAAACFAALVRASATT